MIGNSFEVRDAVNETSESAKNVFTGLRCRNHLRSMHLLRSRSAKGINAWIGSMRTNGGVYVQRMSLAATNALIDSTVCALNSLANFWARSAYTLKMLICATCGKRESESR
jgi:hypothetical protein